MFTDKLLFLLMNDLNEYFVRDLKLLLLMSKVRNKGKLLKLKLKFTILL